MELLKQYYAAVLGESTSTPVDLSTVFDVEYLPDNATSDAGQLNKVTNGDEVRVWEDTNTTANSGIYDSPYTGVASITRYGGIPTYQIFPFESRGHMFLPNVNDARWQSTIFTAVSQPITEYWVIRDLDGLDGENWWKGETNLRDGTDSGSNNMRIGITQSENVELTVATRLIRNAYNIIKVVYNGSSSQVFLNGSQLGSNITLSTPSPVDRINFGSQTNASHSLQYYRGIKFGLLTTEEDTLIYNTLNSRYPAGQVVQAPFASNIDVSFNTNGEATATYTENLFNSAAIATVEVEWLHGGNGGSPDLQNQVVISGETGVVMDLNDNPSIFGASNPSNVWYKPSVKLTDVNGRTFMYTDPDNWTRDNVTRTIFVPSVTTTSVDIGFRQTSGTPATTTETSINEVIKTSGTNVDGVSDLLDIDGNATGIGVSMTNTGVGHGTDGTTGNSTFTDVTIGTYLFADKGVADELDLDITFTGMPAGATNIIIEVVGSTTSGGSTNRLTRFLAGGTTGRDLSQDYDANNNSTSATITNPSLDGTTLRCVLKAVGTAGSNNRGLINALRLSYDV